MEEVYQISPNDYEVEDPLVLTVFLLSNLTERSLDFRWNYSKNNNRNKNKSVCNIHDLLHS